MMPAAGPPGKPEPDTEIISDRVVRAAWQHPRTEEDGEDGTGTLWVCAHRHSIGRGCTKPFHAAPHRCTASFFFKLLY